MSKKNKAQSPISVQPQVSAKKKQEETLNTTKGQSDWWYGLLAVILGGICFAGMNKHGFVNWDDDRNFYENPLIQTLDKTNFWTNVIKIFQTDVIGGYNPLTIFTFAIDKRLWGFEKPEYWHYENILLHLITVFLVYLLSRRLGLAKWGALFVSVLFAIHPMRVESVAWVTERKDVLFGIFYVWALLRYTSYKKQPKLSTFISILILFTLSLLSKIQAVSLPLSMIAIDYLLDEKISLKNIWNKWPYFALSLLVGFLGILFLAEQGSLDTNDTTYPFWQRIFVGSFSFIIYIIKWLVPFRLSPLYPYPSSIPTWFYPTLLIAPIYLYIMYHFYKKGNKNIVFGLLFFLVNIVFLLQVLGAGQGYLADRFTYIAYFGLFFILGFILDQCILQNKLKTVASGFAIVMTLVFSYMTIQQNKIWKNSDTLWTHVLKYYEKTTLPWGNRANYRRSKGMINEALYDYNRAIALKEDAQTFNSRARLFFDIAKNSRDTLLMALRDYNKAIQMKPGDGEFHINRGATHARLGDLENAMKDINDGLKFKPDHANGYLNRFVLNLNAGKPKDALADITKYIEFVPNEANAWYERARLERTMIEMDKAMTSFQRAMDIDKATPGPDNGLFYYERARTYYAMSKMPEAKKDLNQAMALGYKQIEPDMQVILNQ